MYVKTLVQFSVLHEEVTIRSQAWRGWRRALWETLAEATGQNRVLTGLAVVNLLGECSFVLLELWVLLPAPYVKPFTPESFVNFFSWFSKAAQRAELPQVSPVLPDMAGVGLRFCPCH